MKYIIIDPDEGVFLGTAKNDELELIPRVPEGVRILALFSSNNIFEITKAVSFKTEEEAEKYATKYIRHGCPKAFVVGVEDNNPKSQFVDIVDIVKAGYGNFAWEMIEALPMYSDQIH